MTSRLLRISLAVLALCLAQWACSLPLRPLETTPAPTAAESSAAGAFEQTGAPAGCPVNGAQAPKPSGLILSVTMARGVTGDNKEPSDPTTAFAPADVVHAVVSVKDAPLGTRFTATWKVIDIGDPASCNSVLAQYDVETDGTRNIDFNLTPDSNLPAGSYKVEISVNGVLDQVVSFTVQ